MTVLSPPIQFGAAQGDLGFDFVFAAQAILQELEDMLNVLGLGLVTLYGDLVGTGSDTLRITRMTGAGWAEAFQTLASETDPIIATGITTGFDTITIARHGLAKEETYQQKILTREQGVTLAALQAMVPASWLKTLRQKMATAGAGITTAIGDAARAWDFDDEIDLIAAFHEAEGFDGDAVTLRQPEQFTDFREALRNEPAYHSPEIMNAIQSLRPGGGSFNFLGFRNFASFDVTQSGGGHQGFAYMPGAIGWAVADSSPIEVENPESAMYIPEFGMVIERTSTGKQATARFDANSFFGVALLDDTVFTQRRIVSIDD